MGPVEKNTIEYAIHQMVTTDQTVPSHSLQGIGRDLINRKAPIYRKYVRRREKIETIKSQEISIQVIEICLKHIVLFP